jgi:hypothetical protein
LIKTKYQFEKRQKELARKKKKAEKRQRKLAKNNLAAKSTPEHLLREE